MPKPRVLVLRAPGTNCDVETAFAFEMAGAEAVKLHINQLIKRPDLLSELPKDAIALTQPIPRCTLSRS